MHGLFILEKIVVAFVSCSYQRYTIQYLPTFDGDNAKLSNLTDNHPKLLHMKQINDKYNFSVRFFFFLQMSRHVVKVVTLL